MEPVVYPLFEKKTSTWQYIVACPETREAMIIDPVLDFDPAQLTISTNSADKLLEIISSEGFQVVRLLETHVHADHLTAAYYLQQELLRRTEKRVPICTGHRIRQVQETFARKYSVPFDELDNVFDHLFQDDETFQLGKLTVKALHLPGHTPDHSGYQVDSNVFTGDSIFNPDVGSARCDFPNGDARDLYESMTKLLALPPHFKLYTGHDYPPSTPSDSQAGSQASRDPMPYVTVQEQRNNNKHVKEGTRLEDFVQWRRERDATLNEPRLLHQALQVNIRAGRLPASADGSQRTYLLMPIKIPSLLASSKSQG
ncbi:MBL fold metallo-hydrolase [Aspergillus clavatus NRRL 1]|uniref:Metallo-beta-lactamase superfamily protein n=1 Tax=Aspergillus clavatus (strain ATCC 1007 / CBS 513.65 / DSM 816 / NCTC 3887 / NRRL 1 / QM 1276 / 107) TaxID=344612 RepID=A1CC15_ASPCL|nr:metallo-beta-lactamase superfamily protein [Aspergillus clavatus NRRL 1]EAW13283.1 metallo-beta-lactamase superfamily protein [Aspergillus clavatus NRRL 1]